MSWTWFREDRDEDGIPASPPEEIEAWAAGLSVPAYVIDSQTAIKVVDGTVEVVSEGTGSCLPQPGSKLVVVPESVVPSGPPWRLELPSHQPQGG
jgi:hypothetical protein